MQESCPPTKMNCLTTKPAIPETFARRQPLFKCHFFIAKTAIVAYFCTYSTHTFSCLRSVLLAQERKAQGPYRVMCTIPNHVE